MDSGLIALAIVEKKTKRILEWSHIFSSGSFAIYDVKTFKDQEEAVKQELGFDEKKHEIRYVEINILSEYKR